MLVPTMNDQEITRAVWKDLAVIEASSTIPRLRKEYDRERCKKKIPAGASYPQHYPIRTKAKNNWIFFLQKAPSEPRYRGSHDVAGQYIVYYFGPKGITAFKPDGEKLFVYQAHLFTRYNRRMELGLTKPVDKVIHFFTHNGCSHHLPTKYKGKEYSIGICRDGVLLGETRPEVGWIFNRTFVNRAIFYRYQHLAEAAVIQKLIAWSEKAERGLVPEEKVAHMIETTTAIFSRTPAELAGSIAHRNNG